MHVMNSLVLCYGHSLLLFLLHAHSLQPPQSSSSSLFLGRQFNPKFHRQHRPHMVLLQMRDVSASYWFQVGDRVRVCAPVILQATHHGGTAGRGGMINNDNNNTNNSNNHFPIHLLGWEGVVVEAWEKCSVDPTCCCAEQVDAHLAVRVEFANVFSNTATMTTESATTDIATTATMPIHESSFTYYFAEEELCKVM